MWNAPQSVAMLAVSPDRGGWLRRRPMTPVIVVLTLPAFEGLDLFRIVRLLRGRVARRLAEEGRPAWRLVLVGVAASRFTVETVPDDSLVIHGETDDVVPLSAVLDWARPMGLPVVVVPGTGHFFHGRLTLLKRLVSESIAGARPGTAPDDAGADAS